jgi:hypothetical protein
VEVLEPQAFRAGEGAAERSYWLCPRGTSNKPFPNDWFDHDGWRWENTHGYGTGRRGRPNLLPGDQIVWYAVTHQVMYGLAEVLEAPVDELVRPWQADEGWNWYIKTRTSVVIPDLLRAPTLEQARLGVGSVRSYRSLTKDGFARCAVLIRSVGTRYDGE